MFELKNAVESGKTYAGVVIPRDFEKGVKRSEAQTVTAFVNGSNVLIANLMISDIRTLFSYTYIGCCFGYNNWNKRPFLRWKNGFAIALYGLKLSKLKRYVPCKLLIINMLNELKIPVFYSSCRIEFSGYLRLFG